LEFYHFTLVISISEFGKEKMLTFYLENDCDMIKLLDNITFNYEKMIANLNTLPIKERIQLVEDLWDSIAEEKAILPVTKDQKIELDSRLEAYALDGNKGKESKLVFAEIRNKL